MKRPAWITLVFLLWRCAVGFGAEQSDERSLVGILDPDGQYDFAMRYYHDADYPRAAAEFDRFVHFFPDDPRVQPAMLLAAEAIYREGRSADALKRYRRIIERYPDAPSAVQAELASALCLMDMNERREAKALLLAMAGRPDASDAIRNEALYRAAWIDLTDARFPQAAQLLSQIDSGSKARYRIDVIQQGLAEAEAIPHKDPVLSGILSIIPGAGYAYCERYRDAAMAFFLNTAFIAATVEAFRDGNDALGILLGFVGSGFYMGNLYGGVNAAEKYNRQAVRMFIDRMASDVGVHPNTGIKTDAIGVQIHRNF